MSYIQIELGGKERGLKFNNAAVDAYWSRVNFKEANASSIYAMVYAGLIGNDIAKGIQDSDFEYEQVTEWVDELFDKDEQAIVKISEMFVETTSYKKRLEKIQEKVRQLSGKDDKVKKKKK